ncbi:MAG TPA: magnesium transporter CorA family protein [Micropepsaceae bacterium]|nr:magnesium transporter CorA family protein [Micropepsaceae bacterium]
MIESYGASAGAPPIWVDLFQPTEAERHQVEAQYKIDVPSKDLLSEIESSSRLFTREGFVCVSMPTMPPRESEDPVPPPLGFVLTPAILVTIRFSEIHGITQVAALFKNGTPPSSSIQAFVSILEAMVDYGADVLERLGQDVAGISRRSFRQYAKVPTHISSSTKTLRATLVELGSAGEHISEVRDTLLGLQRIASFVSEAARTWFPKDAYARLQTIRRDVLSLTDFETHLSNKVQFLLDAVLGFINTEQNEIFKVLTIASVVGIPPTLIASMYGMNFKNMPELSWSWGYQFGLALIVISTVLPILWFKSRRWW